MPVKLKHTNRKTGVTTYTDYYTVEERLREFREDHASDTGYFIETNVVCEDETQITVKASVATKFGKFQAHARSTKGAGGIEGENPLEVAETSALGRALGFAGYGKGIPSAEDMMRAGAEKADEAPNGHLVQAAKQAGARPTGPIPVCPEHKSVTGGRDNPHCPKCDWRPE